MYHAVGSCLKQLSMSITSSSSGSDWWRLYLLLHGTNRRSEYYLDELILVFVKQFIQNYDTHITSNWFYPLQPTPAPTPAPTALPTTQPTLSPTGTPTSSPTPAPTVSCVYHTTRHMMMMMMMMVMIRSRSRFCNDCSHTGHYFFSSYRRMCHF